MSFNVKSIGIIGGGPGGLAALYEFLHTNKDGTSSVGSAVRPADERSFDKIVLFEQRAKAGGVWSPLIPQIDPVVPPKTSLQADYSLPSTLLELENKERLAATDNFENPVARPASDKLKWDKLGTFDTLFTNIPSNLTKFSYIEEKPEFKDKSRPYYPFLSLKEQIDRTQDFIVEEKLDQYIRYNSAVENIYKEDGKWVVEVREKQTAGGEEKWYRESFDALVLAWGHYSIPFFPQTPGFAEFVQKFPDVVQHANSYRNNKDFVDKNLLVVGGSISAVNVLQHVYPVVKKLSISRRGPHPLFHWVNVCLDDSRFEQKPSIKEYHSNGEVEFTDGTRETFDKIVLTTGYHFHFPHVEEYLKVTNPGHRSQVEGLYYNTFSIKDPTLGVCGVVTSPITFHPMEASAAALAGVWSGAQQLPPQEERQAWFDNLLSRTKMHNFVPYDQVVSFIKDASRFWPKGRPDPLRNDPDHIKDIDFANYTLVKHFYNLVNRPKIEAIE